MKTQLILTTLIAYFEVASARPNQLVEEVVTAGTNDGSQVQENFRHLFDSLAKNDGRNTEAYRKLLEQTAAKQEQAFHTMKEELQSVRQKNTFPQRNVDSKGGDVGRNVVPSKRETSDDGKSGAGSDHREEMKKRVGRSLADYVNVTDVDVNQTDEKGRTLLHVAAYQQNMSLVDYLLHNGADVNARDADGRTPLHWAVYSSDLPIVAQLIAFKADFKIKDNRGRTPLHLAALVGETGAVNYLMELGCRPQVMQADNDGKTPIDLATNKQLKEYLQTYIMTKEFLNEERRQLNIPLGVKIDQSILPATYT